VLFTPLTFPPLPLGASLRYDQTLLCFRRGPVPSVGVFVDIGAAPIHVDEEWVLPLRGLLGLQIEPAALATEWGSPYLSARLGRLMAPSDPLAPVAHSLGGVVGGRWESPRGWTSQFGVGLDFWVVGHVALFWPVVEWRGGYAFLRAMPR
jgi:hypothetical protein